MPPDRNNSTPSTSNLTPYNSNWTKNSITSTTSTNFNNKHQQQLTLIKPSLSQLKQEILTEDEYLEGISNIIKRDFFPQLRELDAHSDILKAYQSEDTNAIEESIRRMREIVTPTPHRRNRGATPGRTPFGTEPSDTPTYFSETPSTRGTSRSTSRQMNNNLPQTRYDPDLPLDHFQSRYTSEDNSSFATLLQQDNQRRREKYQWAWEAEKKANLRAITSQEARIKLVEMTRKMVEADKNGVVRMIDGGAGRPGDRQLVVEGLPEGSTSRGGGALMIEGKISAEGRLMILPGEDRMIDTVSILGAAKRKGKEKEMQIVAASDAVEFVDWDKPTAEIDEDNRALRDGELQVRMEGWKFTNRNTFMFPPDVDADSAMNRDPIISETPDGILLGEPKSIRYAATRLEEMSKPNKKDGGTSPTRSRINAAITGTPYHAAGSSTPKVKGFSFVDALPTPRAATIDPQDLQDLMTWGTIESTPIALRSTGSIARSILGDGGGPFKIVDTSKREVLAHKMANKARKSLASKVNSSSGGSNSSSIGLRRRVLDGSIRGNEESTPRSPNRGGNDLSPAAKNLLGRTGQGKRLEKGMATSTGWEEEDRKRLERARIRAREVESRERLKRARWSVSPAPGLGFDPELP